MYYTLLSAIQTTEKLLVCLLSVTVVGRHREETLVPVTGLAFKDLVLDDKTFIGIQYIQRILDPADDQTVVLQMAGIADTLVALHFLDDPLAEAVVLR